MHLTKYGIHIIQGSRLSCVLCEAINSDPSSPAIYWAPVSSCIFSDTSLLLSEDRKNREWWVYAYTHVHLYTACVTVYKLAAWFSRMLNSNSCMRTFKHPIHLKTKAIIWVPKYNFRPSYFEIVTLLFKCHWKRMVWLCFYWHIAALLLSSMALDQCRNLTDWCKMQRKGK